MAAARDTTRMTIVASGALILISLIRSFTKSYLNLAILKIDSIKINKRQ
ncbi:MAG: hypothetical protein AABX40_03920 [Candidatus Hydrothermarchaeota archaeon]